MAKPGEHFYLDARGIKAEGIVTNNGFVALAGSEVRNHQAKYLSKYLIDLRRRCLSDGTIKNWRLTSDVAFSTPSSAILFLFRNNASGPQLWKDENGMSMLEHDKLEVGVLKDPADREHLGFLRTVEGNEGSKCYYPTRLDTYGCGCGHDCSYCYAKDLILRTIGPSGWDPKHPKIADIGRIENRIKRGMIKKGDVVRLGGITDCFQPIELKYRITLETIKLLNKYEIGYLIVTKSHIVANDEYIKEYDPKLAHFQITTTTFDDVLSARYENASPPTKRIEAIEKLQELGFDTFLRLSPYVSGWIDFTKLNRIRCDKILVEFLRINASVLQRFDIDASEYTHSENGYYNLPLERKLEILKRITGFKEVSVCDDCTEHYNYFRDHFNPNPQDCCNLRK